VIAKSALSTYTVTGDHLAALSADLAGKPGIDMVAPLAPACMYPAATSPRSRPRLRLGASITGCHWQHGEPSLEDVFIDMNEPLDG